MPQDQGEKRKGGSKVDRERKYLKRTQLCRHMNNCNFYPDCIFAHNLYELQPAPEGWKGANAHYWVPGTPKPSPDIIHLIQDRAHREQAAGLEIPNWARQLLEEWTQDHPDPVPPWANRSLQRQ